MLQHDTESSKSASIPCQPLFQCCWWQRFLGSVKGRFVCNFLIPTLVYDKNKVESGLAWPSESALAPSILHWGVQCFWLSFWFGVGTCSGHYLYKVWPLWDHFWTTFGTTFRRLLDHFRNHSWNHFWTAFGTTVTTRLKVIYDIFEIGGGSGWEPVGALLDHFWTTLQEQHVSENHFVRACW